MAIAKTSSAKKTAEKNQERKKRRGAFLAVFLILLFSALAGSSLFFLRKVLFLNKPRLTLQKIRVSGTGYWKTHPVQFIQTTGLQKGSSLFGLDLSQLRSQINHISNIENCSVRRVLPDTLVIEVTERVPRAVLGDQRSPWVLDTDTVVMARNQVMSHAGRLPEIIGISLSGVRDGEKLEKARCAVDLIMMTVRSFPDLKIYRISLKDPEKMDILLQYRKFSITRVLIPVKNRGLSFMLMALQSAIIHARQIGETRNFYDLSYDGKVVIR